MFGPRKRTAPLDVQTPLPLLPWFVPLYGQIRSGAETDRWMSVSAPDYFAVMD